jgi:hypothetical protein
MNNQAMSLTQSYSERNSLGAMLWAIDEAQSERARELLRDAMQHEIAEVES